MPRREAFKHHRPGRCNHLRFISPMVTTMHAALHAYGSHPVMKVFPRFNIINNYVSCYSIFCKVTQFYDLSIQSAAGRYVPDELATNIFCCTSCRSRDGLLGVRTALKNVVLLNCLRQQDIRQCLTQLLRSSDAMVNTFADLVGNWFSHCYRHFQILARFPDLCC